MNVKKTLSTLALSALFALPVTTMAETTKTTTTPVFGDYQAVGFLSDYSKIPHTKNADGDYVYVDEQVEFNTYNKLLVDRIKIWFKEDSKYKGIDPDELKVLTDYFYDAINKAVGDAYPLVKEPGPGVLRMRIAITDLEPNQPMASVATLAVPFAWVADAGSGVVTGKETGSTVFTGHATIEVEALDSVSSEQLAAAIETESGKKYNWTHGVTEGVTGYVDAYSKWAYTKKAMDDWAHQLRVRLDEFNGKTGEE